MTLPIKLKGNGAGPKRHTLRISSHMKGSRQTALQQAVHNPAGDIIQDKHGQPGQDGVQPDLAETDPEHLVPCISSS